MAERGSLRGEDRAYTGYRRAGIRLQEPEDPLLKTPVQPAGMAADEAVHWFDRAHLAMLSEQGIVPADAAARCLRALQELAAEGWDAGQIHGDGAAFRRGGTDPPAGDGGRRLHPRRPQLLGLGRHRAAAADSHRPAGGRR